MPSAPLRLAFVGQSTFFRACALHSSDGEAQTTFVEFREGGDAASMRRRLEAFAPDAVVVFRPEVVPAGALAGLAAPVLGFLTEPVPRRGGERHWDLAARRRQLSRLDPANVDRLVSFDPLIIPTAEEVMPVWRSLPLPVADQLYQDVAPAPVPARLLFVGRSTIHREQWLARAKHELDAVHVAFGAGMEELGRLLEAHDVTFNIHNEPYPSFENRVLLHLAAGHLVISEPLDPTHGLEAGRDYLEARTPERLYELAACARAEPQELIAVRRSGRAAAERFRASVVWPALARELLAETRAG